MKHVLRVIVFLIQSPHVLMEVIEDAERKLQRYIGFLRGAALGMRYPHVMRRLSEEIAALPGDEQLRLEHGGFPVTAPRVLLLTSDSTSGSPIAEAPHGV